MRRGGVGVRVGAERGGGVGERGRRGEGRCGMEKITDGEVGGTGKEREAAACFY